MVGVEWKIRPCTAGLIQPGLESRRVVSGNNGERRAGPQRGRELQNIEIQYKRRAIEGQIAGGFKEI